MAPSTISTAATTSLGLTNINNLTERDDSNHKAVQTNDHLAPPPKALGQALRMANQQYHEGFGMALSDTPLTSAPPSPRL